MVRRLSLSFVWCVLATVWAAPAAAQARLTLAEAVTATLARNPSLKAARAQVDKAAADSTVARSAWWPRLTMAESMQRGNQPVFAFGALLSARSFTAADFAIDRLNHPGATNLYTTRLSVGQLLFDGSRTPGQIRQASAAVDQASAAADQAAADLALAVTRAYGDAVTMQASIRAIDAAIEAGVEDLARAEHRREAGVATDADVLAMSVHLADLRQRRLQLEADLASVRAGINRLMGAPVDDQFQVAENLAVPTPAPALDALFVQALSARPELRQADAQVSMAAAGTSQARSVWMPQVFAQAGVEWNGLSFGERRSAWVIGAEARWNLSLSGADRARIRGANATRVSAEAHRDDVRAAVRVDVLTAARQLDASIARVSVGADAVAQARERARVVRNRYEAGLATMTDVLTASSAMLDAESHRVAALVDAVVAHANLERAVGRAPQK